MRNLKSEIVFRGHHDKLADQLSDGILQYYLQNNPSSDINIEVVGGEDTIFVTGNINNVKKLDVTVPIKNILSDLNYNTNVLIVDNSCQSKLKKPFMHKATSIYGYATNETDVLLPKTMLILQDISKEYEKLRKYNSMFLPDGKVIIQGIYEDNKLKSIKYIDINHQNTGENQELIQGEIYRLLSRITNKYQVEIEDFNINSHGPYKKGGFNRDTGLTGEKLAIDSYFKLCNNTDFIMSGKSIYGLRSAVYEARDIAKVILSENGFKWCEVKVDYDENKILPSNITVTTNEGNFEVNQEVWDNFKIHKIINKFDLINKNFVDLAAYGQIQN